MSKEFRSKRTLSSHISAHIGKRVTLLGWLYKKRELGGMTFLVLRDRHGLVQILDEKSVESQKLKGLQQGTVLEVEGLVVEEKRAALGVEIHEPLLTVLVPVKDTSPIEIDKAIDHKAENLETLLENKIVNMRNVVEQGIWKIQAGVGKAVRAYLAQEDFTEFHSPKILAESTEGGAEVFHLDYFGKEATLAQSAQFYKQIMVGSLERVYEIGATYRAEPSATTRHMTEFTTVDVEMGFINGVEDVMEIVQGLVNSVSSQVWKTHSKELEALKAVPPKLTATFPAIPMKELHELYTKEVGEDTRAEKDPTPAEERWICEYSAKKWGSEAVFITGFPASHMKFYHFQSEKDANVAERFDLIFRGVEIVTGSQREHRYAKILEQMKRMGGDPENPGFKYFLQCFKFGMPPHGGFGLGLERLVQKLIGLGSVKEATLFPRDINRLAP